MSIEKDKQELLAVQKDEVFAASIQFIKTLTGMEPPPIEVAPPEVFQPFKDFTEKVCSIFADTHPQPKREWVGLTDEQTMAGYKLACSYGVYESKAFDLTEKMFSIFKEKNT